MNKTKEYLDKLKEDDYIAWNSVVNDPYITGGHEDCTVEAVIGIVMVGLFVAALWSIIK